MELFDDIESDSCYEFLDKKHTKNLKILKISFRVSAHIDY